MYFENTEMIVPFEKVIAIHLSKDNYSALYTAEELSHDHFINLKDFDQLEKYKTWLVRND